MSPTGKIRTLERRMSYLESVLTTADRTDLTFIRAEYSALKWAIPILCTFTDTTQVTKPLLPTSKGGGYAKENDDG
jgi:hypothetical protein